MLLLVLVLVLIAFGLLVVALLSGSALWAWVSVAVSVVAAGVLLIDWLQRRSAVRTADRQQAAQAAPPGWTSFDADPVTEQIPVIRPQAVASPDVMAADTVVVGPADQPPVSPQQPSSAPPWLPESGGSESQRVAGSGVNTSTESPPTQVPAADVDPAAAAGRANGVTPAEPPTQAHPAQAVPVKADDFDVEVEKTTVVQPPAAAPKDAPKDEAKDATDSAADSTPARADGDALATAGAADGAASESSTKSAADSDADDPDDPDDDADAEGAEPAPTAITKSTADDVKATGEEKATKAPTGAVSAAAAAEDKSDQPAGTTPAGAATAGAAAAATAGAEEKTSIFEKPDTTNEQTVAFPVSAETEPPEEPRDPGNAAMVAELTDVVVVIDERPRYHVSGCRFLPGKTEIPLPVKEAVELGFTPCGWCNPDRTLSNKHRATSSR